MCPYKVEGVFRALRFRKLSPLLGSVAWFMWAIESLSLLGKLHSGTSFLAHTGNLVPLSMGPELDPPLRDANAGSWLPCFQSPSRAAKSRQLHNISGFFDTLMPSFSDPLERHRVVYQLLFRFFRAVQHVWELLNSSARTFLAGNGPGRRPSFFNPLARHRMLYKLFLDT